MMVVFFRTGGEVVQIVLLDLVNSALSCFAVDIHVRLLARQSYNYKASMNTYSTTVAQLVLNPFPAL